MTSVNEKWQSLATAWQKKRSSIFIEFLLNSLYTGKKRITYTFIETALHFFYHFASTYTNSDNKQNLTICLQKSLKVYEIRPYFASLFSLLFISVSAIFTTILFWQLLRKHQILLTLFNQGIMSFGASNSVNFGPIFLNEVLKSK